MKYLIHIEPDSGFSKMVERYRKKIQGNIGSVPEHALHCTVMRLYSRQDNESHLLDMLDRIHHPSFSIQTGSFDLFDENSLVIKLKKSPQLTGLHERVIGSLRGCIDWKSTPPLHSSYKGGEMMRTHEAYGSPHYGRFYNPHVTIARIRNGVEEIMDADREILAGHTSQITNLYASRKEKSGWKIIGTFPLIEGQAESLHAADSLSEGRSTT